MLLDDILTRGSVAPKRLVAPGPGTSEIETLVRAALTAPDHGGLRPWRFLHIPDDKRNDLADLFADVAIDNPDRAREKALYAPCLIAVIARLTLDNPNIPVREQYASVGAAISHMLLAANAMGYGAIFLSGQRCFDPRLLTALGLDQTEELMGFLSVGSVTEKGKPKVRPDPADHLSQWAGPP